MGEQDKKENSINDVRKFLNTPENPITMSEFQEFWQSLTDEEKEEYKKGLPPKSE